MPHILEDRVLESSTTTGTGALTLAAAVVGFRRFSAVCAVADTVDYFIEAIDSVGLPTGDYEYGIGTYSAANTLTRTTVVGSSNGGAAVNFAAGSKNVGIGLRSSLFGRSLAANGYQKLPGGLIMQWGSAITNGSGVATFTYPIAFPTGILSAQATYLAGSLVGDRATVNTSTGNATAINGYLSTNAGAAVSGGTLRFLVIGH